MFNKNYRIKLYLMHVKCKVNKKKTNEILNFYQITTNIRNINVNRGDPGNL